MSGVKVVKSFDEMPPVVFAGGSLNAEAYSLRVLERQYLAAMTATQTMVAAVIQFTLKAEDGLMFLRLWNEGEFDAIRKEWPDCPDECFAGAEVRL